MLTSALLTVYLAAAAPLQADVPPAVVTGRVVDASTGHPIAMAVVIPYGTAARVPSEDGSVVSAPRALTSTSGAFVIRGLRPGSLILHASKAGFIEAAIGQTRPGGYGRTLTIEPGSRTVDLEIRMWRDSVITGTVTDESGDPAVAVRVVAFASVRAAGHRRFSTAATATTDDRGVYRIAHLRPGEYVVGVPSTHTSIPADLNDLFFSGTAQRAERDEVGREMKKIDAPVVPAGSRYAITVAGTVVPLSPGTATPTSRSDGTLMVYPTVFFPAVSSAALAATVSLVAGQERANVDLQLQLSRSARVSGVLMGPPGMTSHVAVRLIGSGDEGTGDGLDAAATITDGAGAFTFTGVPQGDYVLSVVRAPRPPIEADDPNRLTVQVQGISITPRVPPAGGPPAPPPVPTDATLWARMPIAVGDHDASDVVVPLSAGARLSGRLAFEGTTEPPDRAIVQRIGITLDPLGGGSLARELELEVGHPDEDFAFRTIGVPPGRYMIGLTSPPLGPWILESAIYQGRDIASQAFDVSDADLSGVVLTFTDRPATISGRVQMPTESRRSDDALVVVYPVEPELWPSAGGSPRRTWAVRPERDGGYSIANVLPGEYYIVAIDRDAIDWSDERLLLSLARSAERITVAEGDHKATNPRAVTIR
jgi:carboxypeptidase family protein